MSTPGTAGGITPVIEAAQQEQLKSLKGDFQQACSKWPGLHHRFVQFDVLALCEKGYGHQNEFFQSYPRIVVKPLIGDRVFLLCEISSHTFAGKRLVYTVFVDDPPGDKAALEYFRELARSACRILFPKRLESSSHAWGHRSGWPDMWLTEIYCLGQELNDPLFKVREHTLEVFDDRKEIHLSPGYSSPTPKGEVVGFDGRSLPWHELLAQVADAGLIVDVLDSGVFRASVHAIDRLLGTGKSAADVNKKRGKPAKKRAKGAGRKPNPRLTDEEKRVLVLRKDEVPYRRIRTMLVDEKIHRKPKSISRLCGICTAATAKAAEIAKSFVEPRSVGKDNIDNSVPVEQLESRGCNDGD